MATSTQAGRVAESRSTMPLLFSYGTLRDPSVQQAVFGRRVSGTPDQLLGFSQKTIEVSDPVFASANGAQHVMVQFTGNDDDRTSGLVLELTDAELAAADRYEPADYLRIAVRFASGREGWVYAEQRMHTG